MTKQLINALDNHCSLKKKPTKCYSLGKIKRQIEADYDKNISDQYSDNTTNQELRNYVNKVYDSQYRSTVSDCYSIDKIEVTIKATINNLDDLIKMIEDNPKTSNVKYTIDMEPLYKIKPNLDKLNKMIGMSSLKNNVVDQILYFSQDFVSNSEGEFMHTVIYGPPGTGKTEIAKIIGNIYKKLGILKNKKFKKATRSDFVAGYLGQTAIKTKELIESCLGGVLFIDEAYSLGNAEGRDSFSKEAIDTLCEALSDHKKDLMVIIAGYENELNKCFFSYNKGLNSRFTWRFKTDDYSPSELMDIFKKKITESNWTVKKDVLTVKWFEDNMKYFKFYGRDMETLFCKIKIAHSRRVFCLPKSEKTIIDLEDIEGGLKMYLANEEVLKRNDNLENFSQIYS